MPAKLSRQYKIKEILKNKIISNHETLIKLLRAEGINVTQATLSRDFADMGVVRVVTGIGPRYVLSADESGKQISKLVGLEILSVEYNESLIIIRTLAGRAQGVAHYIDRLNKSEILGTVGGDDTVLVIPDKQKNVALVIDLIKDLMNRKIE